MRRTLGSALLALGLVSACSGSGDGGTSSHGSSSHGSSSSHERLPESEDFAGGLGWHPVAPLVARTPTSTMRAAEYAVSDHPEAVLAVFHFGEGQGGSVDDNVDRWVDQFTQPDGRASRDVAEITTAEVDGMPVTYVDVRGSFRGMRGGETEEAASQRLLGAIVEGPSGPVFFKLTGPEGVVDGVEDAFRETVGSVHRLD